MVRFILMWKSIMQNIITENLSGRVLDDLKSNTRELEGQDEKRNSFDFALWKKAAPEHIMQWKSKWSDGFPGGILNVQQWEKNTLAKLLIYMEEEWTYCFQHHECEIAQSIAANGKELLKYGCTTI